MIRPLVCIVTPTRADANNGNWQTATRWARLLRADYRVTIGERWNGAPADVLVALHARRSADSIERWSMANPGRPLVVALTGTDLYRDIGIDASARESLALADRLVVLHELGIDALPPQYRAKAIACFQSTPERATLAKTERHLRALMVGHLREEKAPETYFDAVRRLATRDDIVLDHIGAALDPALGRAATALQAECPNYRWLGALPHEATARRIQRAHVLVHTSRIEGGAHVVMEAVRCGTPVIATRIDGNVGMLGRDYAGYIEPGDGAGLATLLARGRDVPEILAGLRVQCASRAPLFDPAREKSTWLALLAELLKSPSKKNRLLEIPR